MQSKTSFFNTAVLRKDITRFAPIWGGYTLCALLLMLLNRGDVSEYSREFEIVSSFTYEIGGLMPLISFGYALVVAQALFGDLYNSRSCYALHAMPLRRETWYVTHVVSGLLFALVPNLILTLVSIPMVAGSCVVKGWMVPVYTFLAADLQYIFFFGTAVFAAFCTGNRLGMLGIYCIINGGVAVAGLLVEAIYLPLLLGVTIQTARYTPFSPIVYMAGVPIGQPLQMVEFENYYDLRSIWEEGGKTQPLQVHFSTVPETWGYFAICAAVGIALLVIGVQLYRKRHLECAGDILAFRKLEPVFMFLFATLAGAVAQLAYEKLSNREDSYYFIFLAVGLVVGWFVGKMLLARTTRVFKKKNLPGLAIVAAFMAVTLGLTWLDPFDVEGWIPDVEEVASVTFGEWNPLGEKPIENPADIEEVIRLHKLALEQHLDLPKWDRAVLKDGVDQANATEADYNYAPHIFLSYEMKDGTTIYRQYNVWLDSEAGDMVRKQFSSPDKILGWREDFKLEDVAELYINGAPSTKYDSKQDIQSLWAALYADCKAGNMARDSIYHTGYFINEARAKDPYSNGNGNQRSFDISLQGEKTGIWVEIYPDAENTMNWLTERGILEDLQITVVKDQKYPANG